MVYTVVRTHSDLTGTDMFWVVDQEGWQFYQDGLLSSYDCTPFLSSAQAWQESRDRNEAAEVFCG
jgi:hypothetical protein